MLTIASSHIRQQLPWFALLLTIATVLPSGIACGQEQADLCVKQGDAHIEAGEYDQAIVAYDEAIRLNPRSVGSYYGRGNAHLAQREYNLAIADYEAAIRLDPEFALAHNNRGLAYAEVGQHDQAMTDYDAAIRLDPEFALPYYNRASPTLK